MTISLGNFVIELATQIPNATSNIHQLQCSKQTKFDYYHEAESFLCINESDFYAIITSNNRNDLDQYFGTRVKTATTAYPKNTALHM